MQAINIGRHCNKMHNDIGKALEPHDRPTAPKMVNWHQVIYNLSTVRPEYYPPLNDNRALSMISDVASDNIY